MAKAKYQMQTLAMQVAGAVERISLADGGLAVRFTGRFKNVRGFPCEVEVLVEGSQAESMDEPWKPGDALIVRGRFLRGRFRVGGDVCPNGVVTRSQGPGDMPGASV